MWLLTAAKGAEWYSKLKINKQSPKVFTVVLYTVIHGFNMWLLQKTLYFFTQLSAALAGYYFYLPYLFIYRIVKCLLQRFVYRCAVVVYGMKVNFYTCHALVIKPLLHL
jgi:hypothetical protein